MYLAVNSHRHDDHTSDNQGFANVPIVSTTTTLERVIENKSGSLAAWQVEFDETLRRLEEEAEGGEVRVYH